MHCCLYCQDGGVWIDDRSSYGTYLNDSRVVDKQECGVGDRLRLGSPGVELLLIAVDEEDV
jgi:pSer/pThr/pTyr-binding forkhead associated (FHA) protein